MGESLYLDAGGIRMGIDPAILEPIIDVAVARAIEQFAPAEPAETEPMLIDARATAAMLSISERTLWSITAPRGDLPCVRIGARVMYSPASIHRWIEQQEGE